MAQALDDLLEALEEGDDATREEASKALAELGDPTTLDALIHACEDEYWTVRAHAGRAVARIGGGKAVEALIVLFNDSIMDVRNDAVAAMASMGAAVVDRLIVALKDERWRVREYAAKTCGEIKDRKAVEALMLVCRDRDGAVRARLQRRWARSAIRKPSRF